MPVTPETNNNITTYVGAPSFRMEGPAENTQLTGHEWIAYAMDLCFGSTPGMIVYRTTDLSDQYRSYGWVALPPSEVANQVLTNGTGTQVLWGEGGGLPSQTDKEGQVLTTNGTEASWSLITDACEFNLDGGGSEITTGVVGRFLEIPYEATITACRMFSDQTGDIVVDILMSTYAGFPTQTSICASALPTISAGRKSQDTTLTGWTVDLPAGTILGFDVQSVTDVTQVTIALTLARKIG